MQKVKTIFCGSGYFATPIITKLLDMEMLDVVAVITQPDKPVGRKQVLTPPPVKSFLLQQEASPLILQPAKLRNDAQVIMEKFRPELIIVADYGQMIPNIMLDEPKYKALNVHGSILPDLRGAVPIPVSIVRGYEKTGISIPVMTPGLDDGPVIASAEIDINDDDTTASLTLRLANLGADKLQEILPKWINGDIEPVEQDTSKATVVGKQDLTKELARFDEEVSSEELDRMVRGYFPWPVAWTEIEFNDKNVALKLFKVRIVSREGNKLGKFFREDKSLFLGLKDGIVELEELQLAGKQKGSGSDYLFLADSAKITRGQ